MKEVHYGYIYKTFLPSETHGECFYIGRKKSPTVINDYWGSGKYVYDYIAKHGTDGLRREILAWADSEEELNKLEIAFIAEGKKHENCMNFHDGGGSWDFINRNNLHNTSKATEAEARLMATDEEYRKRKCAKISQGLKGNTNYKNAVGFGWAGRKHSEKTKSQMSKRASERTGNKNSMYGKFWINDGSVAMVWSADKGDLPAGFVRGRKFN